MPADDPGPGRDEEPEFSVPNFPVMGFPGLDVLGLGELSLAQLMHILEAPGPVNWMIAERVAASVAAEGDEVAVPADTQAQLEELAHAAQTHVVAETGFAATFTAPVRAMGRREWAELNLPALRIVLEAFATSMSGAMQGFTIEPDPTTPENFGITPDMLSALQARLVPFLFGCHAGSMVGYLAQHALGRYDLPLPAADEPTLCFVVPNLDAFEEAWSLERDDLRFYVALHEVVHAGVRSVPWVRERLVELATEYVSAYELDPTTIDARLGGIDPSDPESLQRLAEHPEELLGAMQSDRQREILRRGRVFHAVLEGYADDVLRRIGTRLIPSFSRIHEAMQRHRIERGEAERFVESLLGLTLERDDYERGSAFCAGIIERAGADGLNRLWERAEMEPTPNELEAPGLWLARIDLAPGDE